MKEVITNDSALGVLFFPILIIVLLLVLLNFVPVGLWVSALASGQVA